MPSLDRYRAKRHPAKTPEPVPPASPAPATGTAARSGTKTSTTTGATAAGAKPSYVIQEHHAARLHWDFRLERDGVLVSWAIPKGLPTDKGTNHLAVHVEDHPLEYGTFEGTIPKGEYGAGEVTIWDHGWYETEKWTDKDVKVVLHGQRVDGRYALFRIRDDDWMIHKMDPDPPGWEPLPTLIKPMLATPAERLPARGPAGKPAWHYEMKWDGVRATAYCEGGRSRLLSRNDGDITATYPELRALGEALGSVQAVLDGEIVAPDPHGRPSFSALQQRMHVGNPAKARQLAALAPVVFMVFDLLHLDGHALLGLPYTERRRLLESLELDVPNVAVPPSLTDPADVVMEASRQAGLEGVVAKRAESTYQPGRRSPDWIKVKNIRTQEVVVGGWSAGNGSRSGSLGALLLGIPEGQGLRYVGKVGTGFTGAVLADLKTRMAPLTRPTSPFTTPVPAAQQRGVTWVDPRLVGEVRFTEWTPDRRLRHPTWRGLRSDKEPADVRVES